MSAMRPRQYRLVWLAPCLAVFLCACSDDGTGGGSSSTTKDVAAPDDAGTIDAAAPDVTEIVDVGATDTAQNAEDTGPNAPDAAIDPVDTGAADTNVADTGPAPCNKADDCPLPINPCDKRVCSQGECKVEALPDDSDCDNKSGCALEGKCQDNKCVVTKAKDCDDGNICTADDCDLATGICGHSAQFDKVVCSDGSGCTVLAECFAGSCIAKKQKDCDDGNVCTKDACDPKTGKCIVLPGAATSDCDDENVCTEGDFCDASSNCVPGKNVCDCKTSLDCKLKDDENLCNGSLICDVPTGQCVLNKASIVVCDPSTDNPCSTIACDPQSGACITTPIPPATPCTDGNPCTVGDVCDGKGSCSGGTAVCACTKNADCLSQNDGDPCNGTLYCDTDNKPASCKVNPATIVKCPTQFDTACTKFQCSKESGQCQMTEQKNDAPCDDDNKCTVGDACLAGKCKSGTDTCSCKLDADCANLEDGNVCNGTLFCNKATGQCDLNPKTVVKCATAGDTYCRKNRCQAKSGKCVFEPDHEKDACDDGDDECTPGKNEFCKAGECVPSKNLCACAKDADCKDDGDLCNGIPFCNVAKKKCELNPVSKVTCPTVDDTVCKAAQCQKKTGKCVMEPRNQGFPCDADGDKCTEGDYCDISGSCQAGTNTCQCKSDKDCAKFGADDKCGEYYCNGTTNSCQLNPTTVPFCSPLSDTACAVNKCDSKTGLCALTPTNDNKPCDADGSNCTVGDKCAAGKCAPGPSSCQCVKDTDCAKFGDGNKCTGTLKCNGKSGQCEVDKSTVVDCQKGGNTACLENRCDPADGKCKQTAVNNKSPCGKGTLCTGVPLCNEGTCTTGAVVDCDDSNPCTADSCDDYKGCVHVGSTGGACDDGNKCTEKDVCVKGLCTGAKVGCDEGTPCTVDSCEPLKGCVYLTRSGACHDGNKCNEFGVCVGIKCVMKLVDCDDDNACTTDSCEKTKGCLHANNTDKCDDGNPCTAPDSCENGGCTGLSQGVTATCDDGNKCTDKDTCSGGKCVGAKANCDGGTPCTTSYCHPLKGCEYLPRTGSCDDNNPCTTNTTCSGIKCVGTALKCDDGDSCTKDTCDPTKGCVHTQTKDSCDDGNLCTKNDNCSTGTCQGTPLSLQADCDDGNVCTTEKCEADKGCLHLHNTNTCTDGKWCTGAERCNSGVCKYWKNKPCGTNNACIAIACDDNAKKCSQSTLGNGTKCVDGNKCKVDTACSNGVCVGKNLSCNDGNACTKDFCDINKGCVFQPWDTACSGGKNCPAVLCDDGDACTSAELCTAGICQGGQTVDCDDGSECTAATCDKKVGCVVSNINEGQTCGEATGACETQGTCKSGSCLGASKQPFTIDKLGDGLMNCDTGVEHSLGGWVVAGWKSIENAHRPALKRVQYNGAQAWERVYVGTIGRLTGVSMASATTVVAVGYQTAGTFGFNDGFAMLLGADGTLVKKAALGGLKDERLDAVVTATGGVSYAAGRRDTAAGGIEGWLVKLDKDLNTVWSKTYGTVLADTFVDIAITADGQVGFAGAAGSKSAWVGQIDTDGKMTWESYLSSVILRSALADSGGFAITGHRSTVGIVRRYDKTGKMLGEAQLHEGNTSVHRAAPLGNGRWAYAYSAKAGRGVLLGTSLANHHGGKNTKWKKLAAGFSGFAAIWPVGENGAHVLSTNGCRMWRSDNWGHATCEESGDCFKLKETACDDNSLCTAVDTCEKGKCVHPNPKVCNDNKVCTDDYCDAKTGQCKVNNVKDGTACKGKDVPCVIEGECKAGVCADWGIAVWQKSYGGNGNFSEIDTTAKGNIIVSGFHQTKTGWGNNTKWTHYGNWVKVINPGGNEVAASLAGDHTKESHFTEAGIAPLADGGYVQWQRYRDKPSPSQYHARALRYNEAGKEQFRLNLGTTATEPRDAAAAQDGTTAYLLARQRDAKNVYRNYLFQLDTTTKKVTQHVFSFGEENDPRELDRADDKGMYIGGLVKNTDNKWIYSAALVGTDNKLKWSRQVDGTDAATLGGTCWSKLGPIFVAGEKVTVAGTTVNYLVLTALDVDGKDRFQKKLFPDTQAVWYRPSASGSRILVAARTGPRLGAKGWHTTVLQFDQFGNLTGDKRWSRGYHNLVQKWIALPNGGIAGYDQNRIVLRLDDFANSKCEEIGKCFGETVASCSDGNACTIDLCDKDSGCKSVPMDDGALCEDGNPCTQGDACASASCKSGAALAQESACDDGNPCTKAGKCGPGDVCIHQPVCNDNKPCTADSCDKATGKCTYTVIQTGGACDDGDWCTGATTCDKDGKCVGGKNVCVDTVVINEPFNCGAQGWDGKADSKGTKWAVDGTPSVPGFKSKDCSLNYNNGKDYASEKSHTIHDLKDKTWDMPTGKRVEARVWSYWGTKDSEKASDQRYFRIVIDGAVKMQKVWKENAPDINGWHQWTFNITKLTGGKKLNLWLAIVGTNVGDNSGAGWFLDDFQVVTRKLSDGIPCDFHSECNDDDPCTLDQCVGKRCKNAAMKDGDVCDDGDKCTTESACKSGKCEKKSALDCDDKQPCTADSCSPTVGCQYALQKDGVVCDDGDACTTETKCDRGACLGKDPCEDGNPCTWSSCENGQCKKVDATNGKPCARGSTCNKGVCNYSTGNVAAFAGGGSSCAIDGTRSLWCWGKNASGSVGDGTKTQRLTRVKVGLTGKVLDVDAAQNHTCAVVENGGERNVWCWGRVVNHANGHPTWNYPQFTPYKVPLITDATSVCTGQAHTCAIVNGGRVRCWGTNNIDQLGSVGWHTGSPAYAQGVKGAVKIACADTTTCAWLRDDTVTCWGNNNFGQLGRGTIGGNGLPGPKVANLSKVNALGGGGNHFCAKTGNALYCWGHNNHGQLGDGTKTNRGTPVYAQTYSATARFSVGSESTCATVFRSATYDKDKKTFATQCWGNNANGQLGNGNKTSLTKPTTNYYVQGKNISEKNWVSKFKCCTGALMDYHQTPCARLNGELWCWGYGGHGTLGSNTTTDQVHARRVTGF